MAVKKPTIAVCSASQMSSLSADDVFNKVLVSPPLLLHLQQPVPRSLPPTASSSPFSLPRRPQLRFLLSVIVGLFGCMNFGAGVAWAVDVRQRSRLLKRVQGPEFGFRLGGGSAWTWHLHQASFPLAVATPY